MIAFNSASTAVIVIVFKQKIRKNVFFESALYDVFMVFFSFVSFIKFQFVIKKSGLVKAAYKNKEHTHV